MQSDNIARQIFNSLKEDKTVFQLFESYKRGEDIDWSRTDRVVEVRFLGPAEEYVSIVNRTHDFCERFGMRVDTNISQTEDPDVFQYLATLHPDFDFYKSPMAFPFLADSEWPTFEETEEIFNDQSESELHQIEENIFGPEGEGISGQNESEEENDNENEAVGVCCFCHEECNPMSQSCGRCPRNFIAKYF